VKNVIKKWYILFEFMMFHVCLLRTAMSEMQSPSKPELKKPLTNVQLEILRVFSLALPEEDIQKIQEFVIDLIVERLQDAVDKDWEERGYTAETAQQWLREHMRTPYRMEPTLTANQNHS
jgi:hypothetical protein